MGGGDGGGGLEGGSRGARSQMSDTEEREGEGEGVELLGEGGGG